MQGSEFGMRSLVRAFTYHQRILLSFGAVTLLILSNAIFTNKLLSDLDQSAANYDRAIKATQAALPLATETLKMRTFFEEFMGSANSSRNIEPWHKFRDLADQERRDFRRLIHVPGVLQSLDQYEDVQRQRVVMIDRIIADFETPQSTLDINQLRQDFVRLDSIAGQMFTTVLEGQLQHVNTVLTHDRRVRDRAHWHANLLAMISILITTVIVLIVARKDRNSLTPVRTRIGPITQSDYPSQSSTPGNQKDIFDETVLNLEQQINELESVKDEFIALASHRLRTPATAVKGNVGMILEGYCGDLTPEQRSVLNDAYSSNEHQLAVIENLLTVSRLNAGRLVLCKTVTNLSAMTHSVAAAYREVIDAHDQILQLEMPSRPVELTVDASRLRVVLENLVSNASKFTPKAGRITIKLNDYRNEVIFSVQDTGVGIPEHARYNLFKKFSRIANPLSVVAEGTGLGLYLANEIVALHGGRITVQSMPGQGSTFTVYLPKER